MYGTHFVSAWQHPSSAEGWAVPRPGKRQLNVFLTDESFDAWRTFCDEHGVSVTAMIEAMGLALGALQRPSGVVADVVKEARRIDGERRRGTRRL